MFIIKGPGNYDLLYKYREASIGELYNILDKEVVNTDFPSEID